jgi:hypothetical protein
LSEPLPRAILDSDVIFSRVLHELFGRVAAKARLLDLIWSEPLLAEAERVLVERKPVPPVVAARWVGYLREAFPQGAIDISRLDPTIDLARLTNDPDDQHVCALAIVGEADYLFSFDRGYRVRNSPPTASTCSRRTCFSQPRSTTSPRHCEQ